MSELTKEDLRFVVSRLPKDVVKMLKERGIILGGGFVRATIAGEKAADIDVFGSSRDLLEAATLKLAAGRRGARVHESKNAFTVLSGTRLPVQFVFRWLFDAADSCMDSFDFTVAQSVIWWEESTKQWKSICHDTFYSDLAAKRLNYTSPKRNEDAGGSLLRVRKFLARGYNIQAPSLAAVLARLFSAVDWSIRGTSEEDFIAEILCGLLREVDPLVAIDGIDMVDEHEVEGV